MVSAVSSVTEMLNQSVVVFSKNYLPIDHVIPRSKGGKHSWDNVVIACEPCNSRKGDRTPLEAAMVLRTMLKAPTHPAIAFAEKFWREQHLNSQLEKIN
jgi:5-methylcytosine-specific restriction endonuclease McrA